MLGIGISGAAAPELCSGSFRPVQTGPIMQRTRGWTARATSFVLGTLLDDLRATPM